MKRAFLHHASTCFVFREILAAGDLHKTVKGRWVKGVDWQGDKWKDVCVARPLIAKEKMTAMTPEEEVPWGPLLGCQLWPSPLGQHQRRISPPLGFLCSAAQTEPIFSHPVEAGVVYHSHLPFPPCTSWCCRLLISPFYFCSPHPHPPMSPIPRST